MDVPPDAAPGIGTPFPANDLSQHPPLELQPQTPIAAPGPDELARVPSSPSYSQSEPTSPLPESSSSLASPSPLSPRRIIPDFIHERDAFLEDLSHFVPVGVLKRCDDSDVEHDWDAELSRLEQNRWIRTSICRNERFPGWSAVRIYVLPDDIGRKHIQKSSGVLRRFLKSLMSKLDTSMEAWEGTFDPCARLDVGHEERESMFYIFNTLESPEPDIDKVSDPHARAAMEEVLWKEGDFVEGCDEDMGVIGLKTPLYAYQRRSAAYMIQRESEPAQTLDPRLQAFKGPTGQDYYYDKEEGNLFREKRLYSEACGGILAETMGFGKTLICLAVILATRGHFPRIPSAHTEGLLPVRKQTGSLLEMAAATAGRFSLPWRSYFERLEALGIHFEKCVSACEASRGSYTISRPSLRSRSREVAPTRLQLCSGTLIVVPSNLIDHWLNEIGKHTHGLKVLLLRDSRRPTPPPDQLLEYDIVLFSRPRFEREAGSVKSRYESPLKSLHWLRIIVDEGHNFAIPGTKTSAVHTLGQLHVERRWVVSGTPSVGLYGIEVALASQETGGENLDKQESDASSVLQARKQPANIMDEELKNIDRLRVMVVEFLALKPWANSRTDDPASWTKYIKPVGPDGKRCTSPSLRSTLQSLVVRHRAEDISKELPLPRLHNKVVYLEPTFYDTMSLNLFILSLTVNIITSERTDQDYIFHPKNRKSLAELITNLRHSGFWWAGHPEKEIRGTIHNARQYLERSRYKMSESDLNLLCEGIIIGEKALSCTSRGALSRFAELGVFLQDFPDCARSTWAIDAANEHTQPLLLGISQARHAQKFVTARLYAYDPAEGIVGAGIKTRSQMLQRDIPQDNTNNENFVHHTKPKGPGTSPSKKSFSLKRFKSLSPESPLKETKIVATASAKLTYLLDKVLEFQEKEKIIIFYEHNNIAYWIAEGLELLGVEFRIYSNTLKASTRSEYLRLFKETETVRVLVMDLRQASHGLHLPCASRIFIVNPIWDPNIESQAIKRAHRISQTRPVYVETLVLRGTLEDKMLKRRKQMSNAELQHAERDPLDDNTMSYIIQNEGFIPIPEDGASVRLGYLSKPIGFFDRHTLPIPDDYREPNPVLPFAKAPVPLRPLTPSKKRKPSSDLPWIESDVQELSQSRPSVPKRQRSTANLETVNGILMEAPGTRTPPARRVSASPAGSRTNGRISPAGSTRAFSASYGGPSDSMEDLPASEEYTPFPLQNLSEMGVGFFGPGNLFRN
ncbi:hypothetical protein AJ79_08805 [Helicocarpus griseus UAMH5409]|uniref:Helicase C-terminal domain-containing protein n=1 Tax=Helicocarpus griseus UAMH5409 TaxID=1447875 RepID=A0A2B7WQ73_9EURO|nr:hypothetical protein AJ79_08805 [Helicocarpus griseus UAMH5409]